MPQYEYSLVEKNFSSETLLSNWSLFILNMRNSSDEYQPDGGSPPYALTIALCDIVFFTWDSFGAGINSRSKTPCESHLWHLYSSISTVTS